MSKEEKITEQQVIQRFQQLRNDCQQLNLKIGELETEKHEHELVIGSMQQLEPSRKCFRLLGGVLVERTAEEVLPAVIRNRDNLLKVLEQLNSTLVKREAELSEWVTKYKIRIRNQDDLKENEGENEQPQKPASAGVLV